MGIPLPPIAYADLLIATCVGRATDRRTTSALPVEPMVGVAGLAVLGGAVALAMSVPAPIDGLLAVVLVGMAAERCAAAIGRPAVRAASQRPANDNPLRPLLPHDLLRC